MHRILHGNQEAQEEIKAAVETKEVNFSQKIARGKYIHEIMTHEVKPECVKEYMELMYVSPWAYSLTYELIYQSECLSEDCLESRS